MNKKRNCKWQEFKGGIEMCWKLKAEINSKAIKHKITMLWYHVMWVDFRLAYFRGFTFV